MTIDIRPDRNNWRQFCQEPPLTDEEATAWDQMAQAIKAAYLLDSTELDDFIAEATADERAELRRQNDLKPTKDSWADLVAWAEASRRLKRAEIKAWQAWKERAARQSRLA